LDVVWRRLGVTTDESPANPQNGLLERGCRDCDYCGFGCRHGAKQDTRRTFLADACGHGARVLAQAECDRLLHDGRSVSGALLRVRTPSGEPFAVEVRAKAVVLAAGAIHTPAVLLRSGIRHPHVGRNLHLHPTTAVYARYAEAVHAWRGVPQSRVCEQFADLDGQGYGVRLEAAPAHPGLWGMALPWDSPRAHRRRMQQLPHLANFIVLTRDRHGGRVRIDGRGRPVIDYKLHRGDARHMIRGVIEGLRIEQAAGALEVFSPQHRDYAFTCGDGAALEAWLERVARQPIVPHSYGLFSAHQMSTCRIAGRREQGVVRPDGRSWDLANLFVADASLMPTACGVNPMITIMGLAHHVAQHVKARLRA
jgi:choline dehydrogenase-like flavoprotein